MGSLYAAVKYSFVVAAVGLIVVPSVCTDMAF